MPTMVTLPCLARRMPRADASALAFGSRIGSRFWLSLRLSWCSAAPLASHRGSGRAETGAVLEAPPSSCDSAAAMMSGSSTSCRLTTWRTPGASLVVGSAARPLGVDVGGGAAPGGTRWRTASRIRGKLHLNSASYGTGTLPTCTRPQPLRLHQSSTSRSGSGCSGFPPASHGTQKRTQLTIGVGLGRRRRALCRLLIGRTRRAYWQMARATDALNWASQSAAGAPDPAAAGRAAGGGCPN